MENNNCKSCICATCADDQCSVYHCNATCKGAHPVKNCDAYYKEMEDSEIDD